MSNNPRLYLTLTALGLMELATGCASPAENVQQVRTFPVPEPMPERVYASSRAAANPRVRTLATVYRYGNQWDEWLVRGDASVATSPDLRRGARLAAWDGENADELSRVAVAAAVYLIPVPQDAKSVLIEVGYQPLPDAVNRNVAGFLFVRNRAVEEQYVNADTPVNGDSEEPGFYGDTYVLPADQTRATFDLLTDGRVNDGILELHLSAGAGQALDIQHLQVKAQAEPAPTVVVYQPAPVVQTRVVESIGAPENYTYTYYYVGPWYARQGQTVVAYTVFHNDINPFWFGGWGTYRAWFWDRHAWVCRPTRFALDRRWDHDHEDYRHWPGSGGSRTTVSISITNYRNDWYQRNFHVDTVRLAPYQITECVRARRLVVAPERREAIHAAARAVAAETRNVHNSVRQQMGDRYPECVRQWQANPAQARRELGEFQKRDHLGVENATTRWRTVSQAATTAPTANPAPATITPATDTPATVAPPTVLRMPAPRTAPRSAPSQTTSTPPLPRDREPRAMTIPAAPTPRSPISAPVPPTRSAPAAQSRPAPAASAPVAPAPPPATAGVSAPSVPERNIVAPAPVTVIRAPAPVITAPSASAIRSVTTPSTAPETRAVPTVTPASPAAQPATEPSTSSSDERLRDPEKQGQGQIIPGPGRGLLNPPGGGKTNRDNRRGSDRNQTPD